MTLSYLIYHITSLYRGMSNAMVARLRLSPAKIQSLANGITQIAEMNDPINEVEYILFLSLSLYYSNILTSH